MKVWCLQVRIEEVKPKSSYGETVFSRNRAAKESHGTGYASSAQTKEVALTSGEKTGTVKTASSDRERKYSDHQPNCLLRYFYCLAVHYFERVKTTDFLEHWARGCCWNLSSGSHRCGECAAQSPPAGNEEAPPLQRAAQIPIWLEQATMVAFICSLENGFGKTSPLKLEQAVNRVVYGGFCSNAPMI